MPVVILALLGVGVAVGFVSGLVGIGGGVLIVPFLYFFYAHPDWSGAHVAPDLQATVAHATSLLVIVPTAIRGTVIYHRSGLVAWRAALPIAAAAMAGAVVGARLAVLLPAAVLKVGFGILLVASGVQLVRQRRGVGRRALRLSLPVTASTGLLVGLLSAFMGVGGGIVAIPLLVYLVGLDLERVAATSLGIIVFAATAGMLTYMISGWGVAGLPDGSLGYVHILAAVPILAGALLSVRWGALLNQRMNTSALRWLFSLLFIVLGLRLVVQNIGVLG